MTKNILEFKLEYSGQEEITPYAGLAVYGELYKSIGMDRQINCKLPRPGSGRGFKPNAYVNPLVLMFIGGGKYLEDIRKIKADSGLRRVCKLKTVPTSDAVGGWCKKDSMEKTERLGEVDDEYFVRVHRKDCHEDYTLDIDAFEIEAAKKDAEYTYNGNKGYMPIAGFIAETGMCAGHEFRDGNIAPASGNYEFAMKIIEKVKKSGKKIARFRGDSAAYQRRLMDELNREGVRYTITARKDIAVMKLIKALDEDQWKTLKDCNGKETGREYAQVVQAMNHADHAFRIIVQRWKNPQRELFGEDDYCYHGIATNYLSEEKSAVEIIRWHNGRSNSENFNKELKSGFNLEYMPCGDYGANAVWFAIGILAYNLFIMSKLYLFPKEWRKKKISTVRWEFIQTAGRVISHSRQTILRICSTLKEIFEVYRRSRRLCWQLQWEL